MEIYIENRAWLTGCQFSDNTLELIKDGSFLNGITSKLPFINSRNVIFGQIPITIYAHLKAFEIKFKSESFNELMQIVKAYYMSDDPEGWEQIENLNIELFDYRIRIFANGFVNMTSQFHYYNEIDLNKIDKIGNGVILINECISEMVVPLFDILTENKVIHKNEYYYFGVPKSVDKDIDKCSSYLVTQHFLTKDILNYNHLTTSISKERHFVFDGKKAAVADGNYLTIWNYENSELSDLDFLNVDFISNCETVLYSSSINSSRNLLRMHNMKNVSNAKESRLIINFLNETLLSLNYLYYYMSLDDRHYYKLMADFIDRNYDYKLFKDTETTLKYSTESIEVEKNQRNALTMQIILGVFTGITLFSVSNDIISILRLDYIIDLKYFIVKILLLLTIATLIYLMIKFVKRTTK